MSAINTSNVINLTKDQVLCLEGDLNLDMYLVQKGLLMVSMRKGTEITPIAQIESGEFIGDLSFFDHLPRSADIIALETSVLIRIPQVEMEKSFPAWMTEICNYMTKRIRLLSNVTRKHGIKRKNTKTAKALTMDEQRRYLTAIEAFKKSR